MNSCTNNALLKWRAGEYLREILLSDADISDLVEGEHIYPCIAPEDTQGNFYVYNRIQYDRTYNKFGLTSDVATLNLRCVSDNYDTSLLMAELADLVVSGTHTTELEDGKTISLTFVLKDSKEDFNDFKYYQDIVFEVK